MIAVHALEKKQKESSDVNLHQEVTASRQAADTEGLATLAQAVAWPELG